MQRSAIEELRWVSQTSHQALIIEQPTRSLDAAQRNRGIAVGSQTSHQALIIEQPTRSLDAAY